MIEFIYVYDIEKLELGKIINEIEKTIIFIIITEGYEERNLAKYLTIDQIKRSKKYIRKNDKVNYMISKAIVNLIYSKILNININQIIWSYKEYMKPFINLYPELKFNITHTYGCTAVAFSKDEIGIDIEYISRKNEYKNIVNKFFSDKDGVHNINDYFRYWVCKEAYFKFIGTGIINNLHSLQVITKADDFYTVYDKKLDKSKNVKIFNVHKNYILGVCGLERRN